MRTSLDLVELNNDGRTRHVGERISQLTLDNDDNLTKHLEGVEFVIGDPCCDEWCSSR